MEENMYREDCSFLIQRCTRYMESHPNAELWLRDTDHKYCPIRLESKGVPREDYKELLSTCPHCGSTFHGKLWGNKMSIMKTMASTSATIVWHNPKRLVRRSYRDSCHTQVGLMATTTMNMRPLQIFMPPIIVR